MHNLSKICNKTIRVLNFCRNLFYFAQTSCFLRIVGCAHLEHVVVGGVAMPRTSMSVDTKGKIRELFCQARRGDAAALEDALDLLRPRIIKFISSRIPDVAAREDIAQDTMIKILQKLPEIPEDADHYAYALTMARNKAVDYIRSQAKNTLTENIDLLADELLDDAPVDFDIFNEIIDFILFMPVAPYRILVYLNNRFVYPARHGTDGRHRGFSSKIVDDLGEFTLLRITGSTFDEIKNEFTAVENESRGMFYKRLDEQENGIAFAEMLLINTLGERPVAIISMWTDRINRRVLDFVLEKKLT